MGKDSRQSHSAHKTFCGGRQSHPSTDRFPKSKSCRIPPADPTSVAHNDGFAEPAKCKNARYTDTLQFPDTAQDQQIVCRHTPAQSCNLHPLKYAPATVFRAAHRAGSFFTVPSSAYTSGVRQRSHVLIAYIRSPYFQLCQRREWAGVVGLFQVVQHQTCDDESAQIKALPLALGRFCQRKDPCISV